MMMTARLLVLVLDDDFNSCTVRYWKYPKNGGLAGYLRKVVCVHVVQYANFISEKLRTY